MKRSRIADIYSFHERIYFPLIKWILSKIHWNLDKNWMKNTFFATVSPLMARRTKSKKSTEKILFLHQNNYLEGSHVFEYILLKKNWIHTTKGYIIRICLHIILHTSYIAKKEKRNQVYLFTKFFISSYRRRYKCFHVVSQVLWARHYYQPI